jgi:hypothetical protein
MKDYSIILDKPIMEKKKRIREEVGQVFQVPLGNNLYGYGQVAPTAEYAFFDYFNNGQIENLEDIINRPVLFRLTVDSYVIKEGLWPIIGILPVKKELKINNTPFTYDSDKNSYLIWKNGLEQILATPEEIYNLECFASWEDKHVEQRLRDHFAGRPNFDVEYFRNQHNPNFERDIEKFYQQYGYDFKLNNE